MTARGGKVCATLLKGAIAVPVAAGIVGVVLPAFGLLAPVGAGRLGLEAFARLLELPGLADSIALTAGTALLATALSVFGAAIIVAGAYGTRALGLAERLLAPLLSVPHAAAALGFTLLFAPSGLILRALSPWPSGFDAPPDWVILRDPMGLSLVAALVLKEIPFLVLMSLAALPQTRARERVLLARSLGYGRMAAFAHAVWPLVMAQLRLPILAVLAFCVSVVDVALILGPTRPPPLAVRILSELTSADLSAWQVGSAGAVLMLLLMGALALVWLALGRGVDRIARWLRNGGRRWRRDGPARVLALVLAALLAATMGLAITGLVVQSVAGYWPFPDLVPANVSASAWSQRLPALMPTLGDTLGIALMATLVSLPLAIALLWSGVSTGLVVYLPLIVPQVAFLFGLSILAISAGLSAGPLVVALGHTLFTLPYVLIALAGPWRALDPRYDWVARSLGHGWWERLIHVRLAMLAPALGVAAALSVAVSVSLYLPTQVLGAGRVVTVTTEAVAAATGGDRRLVALLALAQMALPFAAFALARGVPAVAFRHRRAMRGRA